MRLKVFLGVFFVSVISVTSYGFDFPKVKIQGLTFGDYYYVAQHNTGDTGVPEDRHGFWLRILHFTVDFPLPWVDDLSARFRVQVYSPGDFTSATALVPSLKDLYLKWKPSKHAFILGLSPTPTWLVVQNHWGYRFVEKIPLHLYRMGANRDLALAITGSPLKWLSYHVMFGNGAGWLAESNKAKKVYLALTFFPQGALSFLIFEAYVDVEFGDGRANKVTAQAFAGAKGELGRIGIQFAHQTRIASPKDLSLEVLSAYVVWNILDWFRFFGRADRMFDPNPSGTAISYVPFASTTKFTFLLFGLDFEPWDNVHFAPNAKIALYDKTSGTRPRSDVYVNLAFYWKFSG